MTFAWPRRSLSAFALAAVLALGCDDDPTGASVRIVTPASGQQFTFADDVDTATSGVQIEVALEWSGLSSGASLQVVNNGEVAGEAVVDTSPLRLQVTLQSGQNVLVPQLKGGSPFDDEVVVELVGAGGACPITFVDPVPSTATELWLGPADDDDGEACGASFSVAVEVQSTLSDGSELTLNVNGVDAARASLQDGRARFAPVVLGNRTDDIRGEGNQLSVSADGCAAVAFGAPLRVDCTGPPCALVAPAGLDSTLTPEDDVDPQTPGVQVVFEVQTDASALFEPVALRVGDGPTVTADAQLASVGARAVFAPQTLAEGPQTVVVQCSDAVGNVTTTEANWLVDTTACVVAISAPAADAIIEGMPGQATSVSVTGNISGADCDTVRAVPSADADCLGISTDGGAPLTPGDDRFEQTVSLTANGAQFICVVVADLDGNVGRRSVPVVHDNGAPVLSIAVPDAAAGVAAYNLQGTAGRRADEQPQTPSCEADLVVDCADDRAEVGEVSLRAGGASGEVMASAPCVSGRANFNDVSFATDNMGGTVSVVAVAIAGGIEGVSLPLRVRADCEPLPLQVTPADAGACGGYWFDPTQAQRVFVDRLSDSDETVEVTLHLCEPSDPIPAACNASFGAAPSAESRVVVDDVALPDAVEGRYVLSACATDIGGNFACSEPCEGVLSAAPTGTADALSMEALGGNRCREGHELSWQLTPDEGQGTLSAQVRCDDAPLSGNQAWLDADRVHAELPLTGSLQVPTFPTVERFCQVRLRNELGAFSDGFDISARGVLPSVQSLDYPFAAPVDALSVARAFAITRLGDINADGFTDWAVGAATSSLSTGGVALYFGDGGPVGAGTLPDLVFEGPDGLGLQIVSLGNVDGDAAGTDDFAMLAQGSAYLVLGRAPEPDATAWATLGPTIAVQSPAGGCHVDACLVMDPANEGAYLFAAGAFDTDDEIADLGLARASTDGAQQHVTVVRAAALTPMEVLGTQNAGACLDLRTVGAGDGQACAGTPSSTEPDGFRVELSGLDPVTAALGVSGGVVLARPGDAAAGRPALLQYWAAQPYGAASGLLVFDPTSWVTLDTRPDAAEGWAHTLQPLGDHDGDGRSDVAVGGAGADGVGSLTVYLQHDGAQYTPLSIDTGSFATVGSLDEFAALHSLAGAGPEPGTSDFDGDGRADLLTASRRADNGAAASMDVLVDDEGGAYLWPGRRQPMAGSRDTAPWVVGNGFLSGTAPSALYDAAGPSYPRSVAWLGDLDGDGYPEFAVGEPLYDPDGVAPASGRVVIVGQCP